MLFADRTGNVKPLTGAAFVDAYQPLADAYMYALCNVPPATATLGLMKPTFANVKFACPGVAADTVTWLLGVCR
jgi:hypothetical protein